MSEAWRPIPGWEGVYEVSDLGRVKSSARSVPGRPGVLINLREKILRGWLNHDGYTVVALTTANRRKTIGVHRLVLLAFVGPQPEGQEACHGDGDPSNNRLTNLRWDTRSANTYDRIRHGTHYAARKTHCSKGHPLSGDNLYIAPGPKKCRYCRTCRLAAKRRQNEKKKAIA